MIGVIADDLTGAAEIGAVGLRHGLRAEIILLNNTNSAGKTLSRDFESNLICVDTDSRSCDSTEAAKRAAAAAKFLKKCGAQWIYKKTDSVLRGQVTAEIEAIMKRLKFFLALLLPANPSLGRTIQNGKYFIRGKPIHKTEFARDPHFPRSSANVLEMLKRPPNLSVQIAKLNKPLPEKGIVDCRSRKRARRCGLGGAEKFGKFKNIVCRRRGIFWRVAGGKKFRKRIFRRGGIFSKWQKRPPRIFYFWNFDSGRAKICECGAARKSSGFFAAAGIELGNRIIAGSFQRDWPSNYFRTVGKSARDFDRGSAAGARPFHCAEFFKSRRANRGVGVAWSERRAYFCRRRRYGGGARAAHGLVALESFARTRARRGDARG